MTRSRFIATTILTALASTIALHAVAAPVTLQASDGTRVFGDFRAAAGTSRAVILLFHMAGSNRGEYASIAPVLNEAGFATLAIDQRSGGRLWGRDNETAAGVRGDPDFAAVLPDIDAAIAYGAAAHAGPVVLWGSSYSAALVFVAAARRPDVAALLAFSPAEYIRGVSVAAAASRLAIPVFVTSSPDPQEVASAKALADAVPDARAVRSVPEHGLHGSSTLNADLDGRGAAENWRPVRAFLEATFPRRG